MQTQPINEYDSYQNASKVSNNYYANQQGNIYKSEYKYESK